MSEVIQELIQDLDRSEHEPPAIALGQFERVGSTFYLDQLERGHIVHNEPYKLLLPGTVKLHFSATPCLFSFVAA